MRFALCLALLLASPSAASAESVAALVVTTPSAARMNPVAGTRRVERAIRQALGASTVVRRQSSLPGEASQCLPLDAPCQALIRRALHADAVLVVRLGHARGPCFPMYGPDGRVRGRRMALIATLEVGWLGATPRRERLPVQADDDAWLAALSALLTTAVAR